MDMKDAVERADLDEAKLAERVDKLIDRAIEAKNSLDPEFKGRYQVPGDSSCIKEIDEFSNHIISFVTEQARKISEGECDPKDVKDIVDVCMRALMLLEDFKNKRLNVEFCRHVHFDVLPSRQIVLSDKGS